MLWTNILSGEFERAVEESKGVCGLVVGCVEHHGKHLPLGQDVYYASAIAERAAEKEPIVLFPPMYFGEKKGAGEFAGTIIFSTKLIFDILAESCREIARNGFKKIVLINGHGGNTAMLEAFARSTLYENSDYAVVTFRASSTFPQPKGILDVVDTGNREYFPELTDEDIQYLRDYMKYNTESGHGCINETGITLAAYPELVDLSRYNDVSGNSTHTFDHLKKAGFYSPEAWGANYPNSLTSNYHDGLNERIARSMLKYSVDKMAAAFKVLKDDTTLLSNRAARLAREK